MSTYGLSVREKVKQNQALLCDVPGCNRNRHSLGRYCGPHCHANQMYGHPLQKPIHKQDYRQELKEVSELIDRNHPGHKGIDQAVKEIDAFLIYASNHPEKIPWEIDRLKWTPKVTPLVILKEAAAVTLLDYRTADWVHNKPFRDQKAFVRCLGYRVLKLVPYEKRYSAKTGNEWVHIPPMKPREVLGQFLFSRLGSLLVNIAKTIINRAEREEQKQKVYRSPLT